MKGKKSKVKSKKKKSKVKSKKKKKQETCFKSEGSRAKEQKSKGVKG